ncbi:hypothetical protein SAMN02745687_00118 [Lachnospiraceae bacterium NK3A20]|nr:hypothetical protein SAMN02745687_00118 [Lachnospiraceae bacterium NK3A20]
MEDGSAAFVLNENEATGMITCRVVPAVTKKRGGSHIRGFFRAIWVYLALASLLILMTGMICQYISLTGSITFASKEVASLESDYATLRTSNDNELQEIREAINIDEVKYRAMTELGMSYPDSDQLEKFSQSDDDYVVQFREVDGTKQEK